MGNYEELKQAIADVIKTNGNQEITGAILQKTLKTIISTVGSYATFAGIATPETNPGTPDQNVFYIALQNGTYINFNSIILQDEVAIIVNRNNKWQKEKTGISSDGYVNKFVLTDNKKINSIILELIPLNRTEDELFTNVKYIEVIKSEEHNGKYRNVIRLGINSYTAYDNIAKIYDTLEDCEKDQKGLFVTNAYIIALDWGKLESGIKVSGNVVINRYALRLSSCPRIFNYINNNLIENATGTKYSIIINGARNPNSGYEGSSMSGRSAVISDLEVGKTYIVLNKNIGHALQYNGEPSNTTYISGSKKNLAQSNEITILEGCKKISINVEDDSLLLLYSEKGEDSGSTIEEKVYGLSPEIIRYNTQYDNNGNLGYNVSTRDTCLFYVDENKDYIITGANVYKITFWGDAFISNINTGNFLFKTPNGCRELRVTFNKAENPNGYDLLRVKQLETCASIGDVEKGLNAKTFTVPGDSITAGSGASTYAKNYYSLLRSKLTIQKWQGNNLGSGGSSSTSIAAFTGGTALYNTEQFTIPSDTAEVILKPNIPIINSARALIGVNPCYINGIKGSIRYSSNNYYFAREVAGFETIIPEKTVIIPHGYKLCTESDLGIIFVGTNDHGGTADAPEPDLLIKNINGIQSSFIKTNKVLIIGQYVSTNDDVRQKLRDEYRTRFLDLYAFFEYNSIQYAINRGYIDNDEGKTWQELFLSDRVHPNDIGHQMIADVIYDTLLILGFA